jgi:hypothetical protein
MGYASLPYIVDPARALYICIFMLVETIDCFRIGFLYQGFGIKIEGKVVPVLN